MRKQDAPQTSIKHAHVIMWKTISQTQKLVRHVRMRCFFSRNITVVHSGIQNVAGISWTIHSPLVSFVYIHLAEHDPAPSPLPQSCQSLPSHPSFTQNQPLHPSGSDTPGLSAPLDWTLFSLLLFLFSPLWSGDGQAEGALAISPPTGRRRATGRR